MRESEIRDLKSEFRAKPGTPIANGSQSQTGRLAFGVRRLVAALVAWPTRRSGSGAQSGALNNLDGLFVAEASASPHSTATGRLRKAVTGHRTPKRRAESHLLRFRLLITLWLCGIAIGVPPAHPFHFRKYRVAPRLGTNAVRQRLLRNLHQHALLTETGLA